MKALNRSKTVITVRKISNKWVAGYLREVLSHGDKCECSECD